MVLGLIMAITVLSLGFLARSETEMVCGENMALRLQMDQTAASALEHARGLILNPPDQSFTEGYWTGATGLQLDSSSNDYYDVSITIDANDYCDYDVSCNAYRLENGVKIGRSNLSAQLRLDPSIALWFGTVTALPPGLSVTGDVYCAGQLTGQATVDGDLFADGTITGLTSTGRASSSVAAAPLTWPAIAVGNYAPSYQVGQIGYSPATIGTAVHATGTFIPYNTNPAGVRYRNGDLEVPGSVDITGSLVVDGDLTVSGSGNTISAVQSFPALLVSGDLIIEAGSDLTIDGLAVVEGHVYISADTTTVTVTGGLLASGSLWETVADVSGNNLSGVVHGGPTWDPSGGQSGGMLQLDGVDDYVDCGNSWEFAITDVITVAAWVKTNAVGSVSHGPFVTKGDRAYSLKHGLSSIAFFIYDPVEKWQAAVYAVDSSFNDQWHHVAGTYDGNDVRLYIDGVEAASTPFVGTIRNISYDLNIGSNDQEAGRFYDGAIDEVRLYNRVLDATEILALHDSPALAGDTSGLRARYCLDEEGTTMTLTADPRKTALIIWQWNASESAWEGQNWSQAAGAFFKRVARE
jgi:cytoskeletal protein CcmA (bactofilin family)